MSGVLSKTSGGGGGGGSSQKGSRGGRAFIEELRRNAFRDDDSLASPIADGGIGDESESEEEEGGFCVWETRILLSVLEDIFINNIASDSPLPSTLIQAFQKFLLAVNSAVSKQNHFVEGKPGCVGTSPEVDFEIDPQIMNEILGMTDDQRAKIQELIAQSIGNIWTRVMELWTPILEADKADSSCSLAASSLGTGTSKLMGRDAILAYVVKQQAYSDLIISKTKELLSNKRAEMKILEKEIDHSKDLAKSMLEEEAAIHDSKFSKAMEKQTELEKDVYLEQIKLAELKLEEDKYPEDDEQEEMRELFELVKAQYLEMLEEVKEMEARAQKYRDLGPEYQAIAQEYKDLEELIKTKEWVKDQLTKGGTSSGGDDSLLNDSV